MVLATILGEVFVVTDVDGSGDGTVLGVEEVAGYPTTILTVVVSRV